MSFRLLAALVFALAVPLGATPALAAAAQCPTTVDVRNVMTVTQYNQAGLNKLDKQELAALNSWLSQYIKRLCAERNAGVPPPRNTSAGAASAGAVNNRPSQPPQQTNAQEQPVPSNTSSAQESNFGNPPKPKKQEPGRIESRIVGEFHGWTGNTIFRLKNGQVWKQAGPGYFRIDLQNPKVVIKKLLIGYVLLVEGYGKEVFVRRIR